MPALAIAALPAAFQPDVTAAVARLHDAFDADQRAAFAAALAARPARAAELARVLCASEFVLRALEREPALLGELWGSGDLERRREDGEIQAACRAVVPADGDEPRLQAALRRLRRREMVRVIWRDLNRSADMAETTRDLSLLAEAVLDAALDAIHADLEKKHGEPRGSGGQAQRMVVLGMGKLGAWELNLSSDIDLIFAYAESGETDGARGLSNQEFFTRLGQRLIRAIDARTADGFVFRVDMRLRPYGDAGALALNFDALEEYYQDQGREWERYAMIKARVVAGDRAAGAGLLTLLRPFVYRRYIDFSVIDALRGMKAMINSEVQRRGKTGDVKLGAGGIREIEFIAQSFQLIRGGRDVALQERRLLVVLRLLAERDYLPAAVVAGLVAAYVFLRNTEHVLQAWADMQTQALPEDAAARARVAFAMGCDDWEAFLAVLDAHRAHVIECFANVVTAPEPAGETASPWVALWQGQLEQAAALELLEACGCDDAADVLKRLDDLRGANRVGTLQPEGRARLDRFVPLLLQAATRTPRPAAVIARTMPLVEAVLRRSAYLVLLAENPAALEQLVRLCAASPWIAHELANHPVLLDELIDPRTLYLEPDRADLRAELQQHMQRIPLDDLEAQMEALRYFKLAHTLRCAASEVTGVLPLMRVSDYLSFEAEAILQHVLDMCWHNLVAKHGTPQKAPGVACAPDFLIVAYGKLGGIELGHGSDLDIVFLHDADRQLATDGERALDNTVFFTRLAQRIIHVLTTFTALGQLYEVDVRLRPSGAAGLLVSSFDAFRDYQFKSAWTWEHQALVRARPVAGCQRLATRFEALRREVLANPRDPEALRADVRDMRAKMRANLLKPETTGGKSPRFDLKQSAGGIVDIEFMVQYCALAWSREHPELSVFTDNIRILEALNRSGLVPASDAELLTGAYKAYRTAVHRLKLQQQDDNVPAAEFQPLRDAVMRIWDALIGPMNESNAEA